MHSVAGAGCHCMERHSALIKQVCPLYPFSVMRYLSRHTFYSAFNIVRLFILCTVSKASSIDCHGIYTSPTQPLVVVYVVQTPMGMFLLQILLARCCILIL